MSKKINTLLVSVFLISNLSLFSQAYHTKIEASLVDCNIRAYTKLIENEKFIIETDSINSKKYSKIYFELFNNSIKISAHDKVDSIIKRKYIGKEILSFRRTAEKYGTLYAYVLNTPQGVPYFDKYLVRKYKNKSMIISYHSKLGANRKNFERLKCLIEKLGK